MYLHYIINMDITLLHAMNLSYIYFANLRNKRLARFFFDNKYVLKNPKCIFITLHICVTRSYVFIIQ